MELQLVHAWDNHQPDWDADGIVEKEPHQLKGQVLEAIWIKKTPQNYSTWTAN